MISVIVGLGNPGSRYRFTRHNLGFLVLDRLADQLKISPAESGDGFVFGARDIAGRRVLLIWPATFMNRSGMAVEEMTAKFGIDSEQMLVVVDDFSLPVGKLRLRTKGGDGGHKGLLSIIDTIETDNFPRLRLGIGPVPDNLDRAEYVLRRLDQQERKLMEKMVCAAADVVVYCLNHTIAEAMTKFNVNPV